MPFDDIIKQALATTAPIKQADVASASARKQDDFRRGYNEAAAGTTDVVGKPATAADIIAAATNPLGTLREGAGAVTFGADRTAPTTSFQDYRDNSVAIGSGFANGLAGVANLGIGLVSDDGGAYTADAISRGNKWVEDNLVSDGRESQHRANAARNQATAERNASLFKEEGGGFVAGIRRIGRDAMDAVTHAVEDDQTVEGISQAAGSMFAGGILGKGLKLVGVGTKLAQPLGVGLLEGGGAYQQTTQQALEQGASNEDANSAGLMAAAIQGPIGVATGKLTAPFESSPFRVPSVRTAMQNILKEGIEEAIQGGSGQTAQNLAIRTYVDPDQDMLDGIGEQMGLGALYGMGSAGATQAPGIAMRTGINAATGTINLAKAGYQGALNRADNLLGASSPVSTQNIRAGLDETVAAQPDIEAGIQSVVPAATPAIQGLFAKAKFDPKTLENEPAVISTALAQSTDKFDALSRAAAIAADKAAPRPDRIAAGNYINKIMDDPSQDFLDVDLDELLADHADNPAVAQVKKFQEIGNNVNQNPEIIKARKVANAAAQALSAEQINQSITTPQAQTLVDGVVNLAQESPEKTKPEVLDQILMHAEKGDVTLSPSQEATVKAAVGLHTLAAEAKADAQRLDVTMPDLVSHEIRTDMSKDTYARSASQYVKDIARLVKQGKSDEAKDLLQELNMFARHMQNKVLAYNENLRTGNGQKENATPYESLTVATRKFITAEKDKWKWVNPVAPKSIAQAQKENLDAKSVVSVANMLAATFPKLGVDQLEFTPLDPSLDGPADVVAREFKAGKRQPTGVQSEGIQDTNQEVGSEEKPVAKVTEADTNTVSETPETSAEVQTEGGDQVATTEKVKPSQENDSSPKAGAVIRDAIQKTEEATPAEVAPRDTKVVEAEEAPTDKTEPTKPDRVTGAKLSSAEVMEAAYPDLVGSDKVTNWFKKAFKLSENTKSRLVGLGVSPVMKAYELFGSTAQFMEFIDKDKLDHKLTEDVRQAYQELLTSSAETIDQTLSERLNALLNDKISKKSDTTFADALVDGNPNGSDITTWRRLRTLNLVENKDGKFEYNEELIGSAILAGYQWVLSQQSKISKIDAEQAAKILGVEEYIANDYVGKMNEGIHLNLAVQTLSEQIKRFWGVKSDPTVGRGQTEGIPEAVAKEILIAFEAAGLLQHDTTMTIPTEIDGKIVNKAFARILRSQNEDAKKLFEGVAAFPNALEHIALIDPEPVNYIGTPPKEVAKYQMRNRLVENTDQQKLELEREQNNAHKVNFRMFNFMKSMGRDLVVDLFGNGDLTKRELNAEHKKTLEGQNLSITSAYDYLKDLVTEMENRSEADGKTPAEMEVFYPHNSSRVGRTQMIGRATPQGSKTVREVVLATWSTLDLTQAKNYNSFMLAMAQHWGFKVEQATRAKSVKDAEDFVKKIPKSLKILGDWVVGHDADKTPKLNEKQIATLKVEFGDKLSQAAIHSAMEYARFQNSTQAEKQSFTSAVYLEADGKTDGPINAMMHLGTGKFTAHWIEMMAKGGLFLGSKVKTLAQQFTADNKDLYSVGAEATQSFMDDLRQKYATDPIMTRQINALMYTMDKVIPGFGLTQKDGQWVVEIGRGVVKNPMTITIYGSGAKGIAGNLSSEIAKAVYEKLSDGTLPEREIEALNKLIGQVATVKRGVLVTDLDISKRIQDRLNFKFSDKEMDALTENMLNLFITPLRQGIDSIIGEIVPAKQAITKATQVQSIFQKYAFQEDYRKALEAKEDKSAGLSQAEEDEIRNKGKYLAPYIETGTQSYYLAANERSNIPGSAAEFSRSLDDGLSTPAYTSAPSNIGVLAVPTMIIGPGDGQVMQNVMTRKDPPKGGGRVFDGMNMPLDTIDEDSRKVNEAAFQAWTEGNPIGSVSQSYGAFMEAVDADVTKMSAQQIEELSRVLREQSDQGAPNPDLFAARMKAINESLQRFAFENQARKNVLGQVNVNVDHMASAESPFYNEGGIQLSDDTAEAEQQLNTILDEEIQKLRKDEATQEENIAPELAKVGVLDTDTGVRVVSSGQIRQLIRSIKPPVSQRPVLQDALLSLFHSDYTLVFGTKEQTQAYSEAKGHNVLAAGNGMDVRGYISIGDKTIYLNNPSSETLLHELIHAATFEKVAAFYSDPSSLSQIERDAVSRIETLMDQWLEIDDSNAAGQVNKALANGEKAVALNEFMAWNLSNQDLITKGKKTIIGSLAQIAKDTFEAIKSLIWGKAKPPVALDDLYSNLRFNTAILMHTSPTVQQRLKNVTLYQAEGFGSNDRLTSIREKLGAKIGTYVKSNPVSGNERLNEAVTRVEGVVSNFTAHGFNMSMQEKSTFQTMLTALMTETYLNPNALVQVQELYDHVIKQMKPSDFMPANSTDPQVDEYYAQEKFNAIVGKYGVEFDEQGRSSLLPSFLVLATVNDQFREILKGMKMPESANNGERTLDALLENKATQVMDGLSASLSGQGLRKGNVKEAIDALTMNLANTLEDQEQFIEKYVSPLGNTIDKGNTKAVELLERLSDKTDKYLTNKRNNAKSKVAKFAAEAGIILAQMATETGGNAVAESTVRMFNNLNAPQAIRELVAELVGRTDDNAGVTDMAKHVHAESQKTRQQFREDVPRIIREKFTRALSEQEWDHLYHGLGRTDIAALKAAMPTAKIVALLQDQLQIQSSIAGLEESIRSMQPDNFPLILKKAKQLALYMKTGDSSVAEGNLLRNPFAIANLFQEKPVGTVNANEATITAIDQLVSLYALNGLEAGTKDIISSLAQAEGEGMEFLTNYLIGRRSTEMDKAASTGQARSNYYKGHVPTENHAGTSLIVDTNARRGQLEVLGYKQVKAYNGSLSDTNQDGKSYYFAPLSGRAPFNQGIIQNVRETASGIDPLTGYSMGVMTAGRITDPREVKRIQQRISRNKNTTEPLNPIFDQNGNVVAYERSVDPIQEARLEKNTNLSTVVGQWIGRQVEEAQATAVNEALIDELGKMWNDGAARKNEFINLLDTKNLSQIEKDAVKLFNFKTRSYAESVFGKNEFWVRKDLVHQVVGQRAASVGDFWTGNTNIPENVTKEVARIAIGMFGIDAYKKFVTAEKLYQNFISDARQTIVVKSFLVPMSNGISGIYQLISRGVPLASIVKGYPRKMLEAEAYLKSNHEKIRLQAELEAVGDDVIKERKLRTAIQAIDDSHKRLSIYPILHELSSITDAGVTHDNTLLVEGKLSAAVERWVDKLPPEIRTAGRYAIISKDTALFKGLARAVQYGDFLAKAVLYDDLVKRQGKTKEHALGRIMDEFVNYDLLAGRTRSYMESMGLMWFWHFKIRSVKIALSTLRNNPLHMLMAGMIPTTDMFGSVGMPVTDNAVAMVLEGRSHYSLGPAMGIHAYGMNPWYNLIT